MARARPFLFLQIFSFFFQFTLRLFIHGCHRPFRANLLPADLLHHTCNSCAENYDRVCCLFFFSIARSVAGNELVAKMVTSYVTDTRDEKWNFIGQYVNFPRFLLFVKARLLNLSVGNENLIRNSGRSQGEGG